MPFVKYRLQYASCVSADKITLNHGGKCRDDTQSKEYDYDVEKTEGDDDDAEEERNANCGRRGLVVVLPLQATNQRGEL